MNTPRYYEYLSTPVGALEIVADSDNIKAITFVDCPQQQENSNAITALARQQMQEYLRGTRQQFELPLGPEGTHFQQQVWQALTEIPYAETWSYAKLASHIGNPKAMRAVGAANGRNPIAIVVPCHRVIGANGTLTGYAGGLDRKAWLLDHEQPQSGLFAKQLASQHSQAGI